jgi:CheY-like chemotaxis protein
LAEDHVTKIVLCVDDSVTMQTVADITFRGTEYQYVGARTVEDALDKAKSTKPTLVLADAQMPGKNGYDLCMAMKSDGKLADVPVVILVGNGAPYDSNRGISVGADGSLPKPWDTQTMLEKVNEVVGRGGGVAKPGQPSAATAAAASSQPVAQIPVAAAKSAPAVAAAAGAMPPRSATIMGMPTIKMPAGVAAPANVQPAKTTVMAVPPVSASASSGNDRPLRPPAPVAASISASGAAAAAAQPVAPIPAATTPGLGGMSRSPMVAGSPTKRSALVERTLAKMAARLAEAAGLEPGSPELVALLKLSTEVVERIVWEVVPDLAEQIIRENLHDLTARRS